MSEDTGAVSDLFAVSVTLHDLLPVTELIPLYGISGTGLSTSLGFGMTDTHGFPFVGEDEYRDFLSCLHHAASFLLPVRWS